MLYHAIDTCDVIHLRMRSYPLFFKKKTCFSETSITFDLKKLPHSGKNDWVNGNVE